VRGGARLVFPGQGPAGRVRAKGFWGERALDAFVMLRNPRGVVGEHGYMVLAFEGVCVLCQKEGLVIRVRRRPSAPCHQHVKASMRACPDCTRAETEPGREGGRCVRGCKGHSERQWKGAMERWYKHRGPGDVPASTGGVATPSATDARAETLEEAYERSRPSS